MSDAILEYNFLDGIETSTDEKIANGLEVMENALMTDKKTPKKRNGFVEIARTDVNGNSIGAIVKTETYQDSLLIFTDRGIYVRAGGVIRQVGDQQAGSLSVNKIFTQAGLSVYPSRVAMAQVSSGLICVVNNFNPSVFGVAAGTQILFYKDGSIVDSLSFTNSAVARSIPFVINDEIYIVTHETGVSAVSLRKFTESTATISTVAASISITDAAVTIDLTTDGTTFVVCSLVNTTRLRFSKINISGTVIASATEDDANANGYINTDLIDGEIYTYYQESTNNNLKMFVINYAALTDTSDIQTIWTNDDSNYIISQAVSGKEGNVVYVFIESFRNSADRWRIHATQVSATYVPSVYSRYTFQHSLAGKVATVNGRIYIPVQRGRNDITGKGSTNFCLMNKEFCIIANALHGRVWAKDAQTSALGLCGYPAISGSIISYPILTTNIEFAAVPTTPSAMETSIVTIDILEANTSKGAAYQSQLVVAGPIVKSFDGAVCLDYQFTHSPHAQTAANNGAGNLEAGIRQWFFVAKFVDTKGNAHRSPPSNIISLNVTASNNVLLTFETMITGSHLWGVSGIFQTLEIYRTLVAGNIFYKVADLQYDGVALLQSTELQTYTDSTSDADLDDKELYPYQEILDDGFAPPCSTIFNYKNRLLIAPTDLTDRISFTKEKVENQASAFSEFLFIYAEESSSQSDLGIKGACNIDDKILIFKENSIQYTAGEAPNNAGEGGGFLVPQLLSNEVGLINPASLVQTQNGILFQSNRGIYLITRGLELINVGEAISDKTLSIVSAFKSKSEDLAFFATSNNGIVVYETTKAKWSMFTNYNCDTATIVNGLIYHVDTAGELFLETPALYDDDGSFITQKFTTPWIKVSDLQGFYRLKKIMILGKWRSLHNLRVSIAYDYEDYNWENTTLVPANPSDFNRVSAPTVTQLYTGANSGPYQFRVSPLRQKCEAVKITIEDVYTSANGESYEITGLSLLVMKKRGQKKLPSNRQG